MQQIPFSPIQRPPSRGIWSPRLVVFVSILLSVASLIIPSNSDIHTRIVIATLVFVVPSVILVILYFIKLLHFILLRVQCYGKLYVYAEWLKARNYDLTSRHIICTEELANEKSRSNSLNQTVYSYLMLIPKFPISASRTSHDGELHLIIKRLKSPTLAISDKVMIVDSITGNSVAIFEIFDIEWQFYRARRLFVWDAVWEGYMRKEANKYAPLQTDTIAVPMLRKETSNGNRQ